MVVDLDSWRKALNNFEEECESDVSAAILKVFKLKLVSHTFNAAVFSGVVVSLNESNCPTLYFFYSIYVSFVIGVPNCCSIF